MDDPKVVNLNPHPNRAKRMASAIFKLESQGMLDSGIREDLLSSLNKDERVEFCEELLTLRERQSNAFATTVGVLTGIGVMVGVVGAIFNSSNK